MLTVRIERALRIIARGCEVAGARKHLRVDAPQITLVARIVAAAGRAHYTQRFCARAQGGGSICALQRQLRHAAMSQCGEVEIATVVLSDYFAEMTQAEGVPVV